MARRPPFFAAACLIACLLWLDASGIETATAPRSEPPRAVPDEIAKLPWPYGDEADQAATTPVADDARATIEVTVLSPSGTKVSGATVLAVGTGLWPARTIQTDPDGIARISGLDPGLYDLRATHGDDVVPAPVTVILSREGHENVTLRMVKGRKVTVLVVDGEGERSTPIPSASVVLAEGGLSPFPLEAVTGKDGRAVIGPVAPSMATVAASAEGFVSRSGVRVEASAPSEVEIALVRGGMLVGEVVDARGRAVEGVRLEVVGTDVSGAPVAETHETLGFRAAHFTFALEGPRPLVPKGELGVMPGRVPNIPRGPSVIPTTVSHAGDNPDPWVTRADGSFRIQPVSPGKLRVIARHPEFVEAISDTVRLKPGEEGRVKLVLRAGGTLEGRVIDDQGEPVAHARVDVVALRGTLSETRMTGDDGSFTLAALPDRLSVTVTRPGSPDAASHRETVNVKEGERKQLEIKLPALREAVLVRVKDEQDRPLANAQVSVASLSPKAQLRRTRFTTESGEADFADARGLPLLVEVTLPGRSPVVMELDAAPAEVSIELNRGITVQGSVTTRRGHDPLEGADVTLHTNAGARRSRTDSAGMFHFDDMAKGPARVVVSHAGHASVEREVTIAQPRHDEPFTIDAVDLAEAGSIEGEVVDARGNPVAGARIAKDVVPAYLPGGRLPSGVVVADRRGRFRLDDMPEGDVSLEATGPENGRGRAVVKVTAGRTTDRVTIALEASEETKPEASAPGGVAVTLGERDMDDSVHVIVVLVTPGSSAERAGFQRGDRIVAVDGVAASSMKEARTRLNGPLTEDVIVTIERDGAQHRLRVTREQVER